VFNKVAKINQELSWPRQFGTEAGVNFSKSRNDLHQQESRDANSNYCHSRWIHERGFDLFAQAFGIFKIRCESPHDFRQ